MIHDEKINQRRGFICEKAPKLDFIQKEKKENQNSFFVFLQKLLYFPFLSFWIFFFGLFLKQTLIE